MHIMKYNNVTITSWLNSAKKYELITNKKHTIMQIKIIKNNIKYNRKHRYYQRSLVDYRKNLRFVRQNRIKQLEVSSVKVIAFETNKIRYFRGRLIVPDVCGNVSKSKRWSLNGVKLRKLKSLSYEPREGLRILKKKKKK